MKKKAAMVPLMSLLASLGFAGYQTLQARSEPVWVPLGPADCLMVEARLEPLLAPETDSAFFPLQAQTRASAVLSAHGGRLVLIQPKSDRVKAFPGGMLRQSRELSVSLACARNKIQDVPDSKDSEL